MNKAFSFQHWYLCPCSYFFSYCWWVLAQGGIVTIYPFVGAAALLLVTAAD